MKKLLATLAMVLIFCGTALAYDTALTGTCVNVSNSDFLKQCTYTSSTSIVTTTPKVFRLTVPSAFGNIRSAAFSSATSTNCAYFVSEADAALATDTSTVLYVTNINLGGSVGLDPPVFFSNKDTTMGDYLYMKITPTTGNTGAWVFTVIFDFQSLGLGE